MKNATNCKSEIFHEPSVSQKHRVKLCLVRLNMMQASSLSLLKLGLKGVIYQFILSYTHIYAPTLFNEFAGLHAGKRNIIKHADPV
jgi:hypothetical protein